MSTKIQQPVKKEKPLTWFEISGLIILASGIALAALDLYRTGFFG